MVQLLREAGRAGELSRESQGAGKGQSSSLHPREQAWLCLMQRSTGGRTLHPPPRADPGSSLEHGARSSTSSTAGTCQLSPREATRGGEAGHPALPHLYPIPDPPALPTLWQEPCLHHSTASARDRTGLADSGEHCDIVSLEVETLQTAFSPSTAHPAAQQPPAPSWSSVVLTTTRARSQLQQQSQDQNKSGLCPGGVEKPFPDQRNSATQPEPGTRGRSGGSRRKLAKPSSTRSLRSLVPSLCQHSYPGPAAPAADSCCHPGPNHAVISPTEAWGGMSLTPRASPSTTHQAPTASSARAQLQQHEASSASLAGQQPRLADGSHRRKHVPSHAGTEGTPGTGC